MRNHTSNWQKADEAKRLILTGGPGSPLGPVWPWKDFLKVLKKLNLESASFLCLGSVSDAHLWAGIPNRTSITLCSNQTLKTKTNTNISRCRHGQKSILTSSIPQSMKSRNTKWKLIVPYLIESGTTLAIRLRFQGGLRAKPLRNVPKCVFVC